MTSLSPDFTPAGAARSIRAACAGLALGLGLATAAQALSYKLVIVEPPLAGARSGASDINAGSTVVGWYANGSNPMRGFRWTPSSASATSGSAVTLAPLTGCQPCQSEAVRVNQAGNTVGDSTDGKGQYRAVLWAAGSTTAVDLGLLPGYTVAHARDINDGGEVVGRMEGPTVPPVAFRWTPTVPNGTSGILSALPRPEGTDHSSAYAINNAGTVVGAARVLALGTTHAMRWSAAGITDLHFDHHADHTVAKATNSTEQVFGNASTATTIRAWGFPGASGGLWTDMGGVPGLPKSEVFDLNGPGRVVGKTWSNSDRAFVWTASGGMQDLNALIPPGSYELRQARGLNDLGRIVGEAYGGPSPATNRAFLLIPGFSVRPVTGAVAVTRRPYFEICDPLHACQAVQVTNTSARSLEGPLHVALTRLSAGRHLTNADGTFNDAPFVSLAIDTLAPGAWFEVQLVFDRSPNGAGEPAYEVDVYAGPF